MKQKVNLTFLAIAGTLLTLGVLFLATLSAIESLEAFGNTNYYLFHQLVAVAIGLMLGSAAYKTPIAVIKKISFWVLALNLAALAVVFIPVLGSKFWGAKRWISIGPATFQPSEFLKITSIVYLSAWLSAKTNEQAKKGWLSGLKKSYNSVTRFLLPFVCLLGIIGIILYFQKDASTLGIITITLIAVYFCADTPFWHTLALLVSGAFGALLLVFIEPYRITRFFAFLHPEIDPLGIGFQLKQSLLALGSGGILGKGLGMSTQKFGFLPQAMSDSMFAILGEETGIIGCTIIVLLFIALLWQSLRIAAAARDPFCSLAAIGIAVWITLQAFMNIASSIGIFPLSGIPLPFFSYGGSHVITELMAIGLMLNISKK